MWVCVCVRVLITGCSGCLAQYVGVLDIPWSKVAETIDQLWNNSVRTENGAEEVLKTLDAKLSAAIMHTLENAQELQRKVSTCIPFSTALDSSAMLCSVVFIVIKRNEYHIPPRSVLLMLAIVVVAINLKREQSSPPDGMSGAGCAV